MTGNIETPETIESPYPWTKSSMSGNGGNGCVVWQWQPDGGLWIRDDKDPDGGVQKYNRTEAIAYMHAVRTGEMEPPAELGI